MNFKVWLFEQEAVEPAKQTHVFDFDDTIATTDNPNVVMLYNNGEAAHKSAREVMDWLKQNGVSNDELMNGPNKKPFEFITSRDGYAVYVNSAALAKIVAV